ncbi:hypothetical protein ACH5RR_037318 [Cinchona calisaya]|uniref:DUF4283 domain-containing protein n=1 Tax=Cinchona calisaya TaxID=153742 RepID=A0ABD2Y9G6_9GENT
MAEELCEVMGNFTFVEKEYEQTGRIDLEDLCNNTIEYKKHLIGRVIGKKMVNYTGMKSFSSRAWYFPKEMQVVELGVNMFHFLFSIEDKLERGLRGGTMDYR